MSDEQRVRTMAGWIGVEISKSRVRTPGRAGYGLYRVRGQQVVRRQVSTPERTTVSDPYPAPGPWTPYAFTLDAVEHAVRRAIELGTPGRPSPLGFLLAPLQDVAVPTRWTSAYTGRRDLGVRDPDGMGALARRMVDRGHPVIEPVQGLAGCGCPNRTDGSAPVQHRCVCGFEGGAGVHTDCPGCGEVLTGVSLGEQEHDGTHCHEQGRPHLGPCVDPAGTVRQRQRAANAEFQAEHAVRREAGLRARHENKLKHSDQQLREGPDDRPSA